MLKLANAHYAFHALEMADAHTIQCATSRSVTYVPIPPGDGARISPVSRPSTRRPA